MSTGLIAPFPPHADAETKGILADLSVALSEVKLQLAAANEEIARLRAENTSMKSNAGSGGNALMIKDGLYFTADGKGPFCTGCFDDKNKRIRVSETEDSFRVFGRYRCPVIVPLPVCDTDYK